MGEVLRPHASLPRYSSGLSDGDIQKVCSNGGGQRWDRSFHGSCLSVSYRKHNDKKSENATSPGSAVQIWYKDSQERRNPALANNVCTSRPEMGSFSLRSRFVGADRLAIPEGSTATEYSCNSLSLKWWMAQVCLPDVFTLSKRYPLPYW